MELGEAKSMRYKKIVKICKRHVTPILVRLVMKQVNNNFMKSCKK